MSPESNEIVLDVPVVNRDAIVLAESLSLKATFERRECTLERSRHCGSTAYSA